MNFLESWWEILDLAGYVEAGPAEPKHVACKAETFIEVVGVFSALSDQDIDRRVTANLEEVLRRFSGTCALQEHTPGPGRLAFVIPNAVLEHLVLSGSPACQMAAMFGVSKRTIRRRMKQYGLRKTDLYSAVNDQDLDRIVSEVHRRHQTPATSSCKVIWMQEVCEFQNRKDVARCVRTYTGPPLALHFIGRPENTESR